MSSNGARRSWGSGSLMSETQRTGRVVWIGQIRVGGKQRQRTLGPKSGTGALTKRQAEAALRAFRDELEAQTDAEARSSTQSPTLRATALAHLAYLESDDRKTTTLGDYRGYLDRHLVPFFGDVPLAEIRVRDVEDFIRFQRTEAKLDRRDASGNRKVGLAGSTVSNHVNYLHAIFAFAQRREEVEANPVSPAQKPKVKKQDSEFSFLSAAEVDAVIRAVADDYLGQTDRTVIEVAAWTGLRQGELLALRWRDVLWVESAIAVRASFSRGQHGTPKSDTSRREVPMDDDVARALERHHQASRYQADDDFVFCHPHTGRPYDGGKLRDRFYEAMKAAGFEHMIGRDGGGIVFHSLRHTFGTQMASQGIALVAIKEWMGHADIQTTMIYAKWAKNREADRALVTAARASASKIDGSITARPVSA